MADQAQGLFHRTVAERSMKATESLAGEVTVSRGWQLVTRAGGAQASKYALQAFEHSPQLSMQFLHSAYCSA